MADERLREHERTAAASDDPRALERVQRERCRAGHCFCLKGLLIPEEKDSLKKIIKGLRNRTANSTRQSGRPYILVELAPGSPTDLASRLEELL